MFCPKCGTKNEDGAQFCLSCGARLPREETLDAPAPQAAPKRKHTGLIVGIAVAIFAIAAAFLTFFLLIYPRLDELRNARTPSSDRTETDERKEDETVPDADGETATVTAQQIALAEGVSLAQTAGKMAGSAAFLQMMTVSEDLMDAAAGLSGAADAPTDALICTDTDALLREMDEADLLIGELIELSEAEKSQLPSQLGTMLNGNFCGTSMLAAASVTATNEQVCLPEALESPMLVLVRYGGEAEPSALIGVRPLGGKLAELTCTLLAPGLVELSGLDALACFAPVTAEELSDASAAVANISLRARPADGAADAAWCRDFALASFGDTEATADLTRYSSDPDLTDTATAMLQAVTGGAPDACTVYTLSAEQLQALMQMDETAMQALTDEGFGPQLARAAAAALPNRYAAMYGASPLAASSIVNSICALEPHAAALPETFPGACVVTMTWPDSEVTTVTVIYDGGNGIAASQTAFLPGREILEQLDAELLAVGAVIE